MPNPSENNLYEYAVVRYVPDVEREEFVNVGLVMMCKRRKWLKVETKVDDRRVLAINPKADLINLGQQLEAFRLVGQECVGPLGEAEAHERFRWLTAVRSACISTSRPHPGKCSDLESTFFRLFQSLVEPVEQNV